MKSYKITTLGCKVNQYDASSAEKLLAADGFSPADATSSASIVLVNTCCITAVAMRKSRQAIRKLVRANPDAVICVLGCYSTYHADKISQVLTELGISEDRQIIAGHHENVRKAIEIAIKRVAQATQSNPAVAESTASSEDKSPKTIKQRRLKAVNHETVATQTMPTIDKFGGHQRAFIKIQDGCDAFCSYCVVPYTRSKVWSKSPQTVLEECKALIAGGHREIVLCGVFLGAYLQPTTIRRNWEDQAPAHLANLVREICKLEGLWRVRLSSLEPGDVTPALLEAARDCEKFAPHLHLPLQSGSVEILRKMNRQYQASEFVATSKKLREIWDRPALSTDIIVGFPGETQACFEETLEIARACEFSKIHAFPFSAIEPTPAWQNRHEMPSPQIVRARMDQLAEIERENFARYRESFVGQTMPAIVETSKAAPGFARAMTDRYISVDFEVSSPEHKASLAGQIVQLEITKLSQAGLLGKLAD